MLEIIFEKWDKFYKIILICIVFIIINGYLILKSTRRYFQDNWKYYRSKPYIIPFAGFINPIQGKSAIESTKYNLISILWNLVKKYLIIFIKPFYIFFDILQKYLKIISTILNNFRNQFKIMRNFLLKMVENIMKRIENITTTYVYSFLKIRDGLKKQIGIFNLLSWTIINFNYFIISMLNGPMGKFANFVGKNGLQLAMFTLGKPGMDMWYGNICFSPDTIIKLINGKYKPLSKIILGDVLHDNSIILSTLNFDISNSLIKIYDYKGIIVSGDHIVQENDILIRIRNSKYSKKIKYLGHNLICLITNSGYININEIKFKDYVDTHDININHDIHRSIEVSINKYYSINENRKNDLIWGINENTIINYNNKLIKINELQIGDLLCGYKIKGKIHIINNSITEYLYNRNNIKMLITGNLLIFEDNKWIRASSSKYVKSTKTIDNYVHFCIDNNILNINGLLLRDFIETNNFISNNIIDYIVDNI
jgi:hypothetical protein